jgi:MFS family permease
MPSLVCSPRSRSCCYALLRGLAAGGELGVAGVLIFERAPSQQRGQCASWHTATLALGVGMAVAAILLVAQRSHPLEVG